MATAPRRRLDRDFDPKERSPDRDTTRKPPNLGLMAQNLARFHEDLPLYARTCLTILTKDAELRRLEFNSQQLYLHAKLERQLRETGMVRMIIGKGRQTTVSTYIGARFYQKTSLNYATRTFILTHDQRGTDNLFEMVERFHQNTPLKPSTGASNAKELYFDKLDSGYSVGVAATKGTGRSQTIRLLHWCVAEGTLVVCPDGRLKPVEQFVPGDLVRTHRNVIAPVTVVSQRMKHCWQLLLRGLTSFPLVLSGEHRVWTWGGWSKIDDLEPGDAIGFPVRDIRWEVTNLPFRVASMKFGGVKPSGPDEIALDHDLGQIVGLYLAEGTIIRHSHGARSPSGVTFTVHEDEVDRTIAWLGRLSELYTSMKVAPRRDSKAVGITVHGKSLAVFMEALAGGLDTKRLPDEWWTMGEAFVRGMVHGYLSGDGHFSPRRSRIIEATSVLSAITVGMRDALASLGYGWAGIKRKPAGVRHGRVEREAYTLRLCGPGVERLSAECGKPFVRRQRRNLGNHGDVRIENGYAWLPILSKAVAGMKRVFDFEVGHEDHSYCTLHGATHNSEVAHSVNARGHKAGVVQTVPYSPGTEIILESTGNGPTDVFFEDWQQAEAGIGDYRATFIPWFWAAEYTRRVDPGFVPDEEERHYQGLHDLTMGQIAWRRAKLLELKDPILFMLEYPATATEMFRSTGEQSYINPELVLAARKRVCEGIGPLVVGVDPARFGDDRFSLAWRRGRKVSKVESRTKIGTVEALAWLRDVIDRDKPARMFIDAGGGGDRLYDVLMSWGEPYSKAVRLVNFGGKPLTEIRVERDGTRHPGPSNRRAEMWMHSLDWLEQEGGADIPDLDSLQMDACSPRRTYRTTDQRLQIESKEALRSRGVRSSDEWDAVVLTLAEPVHDRPERAVTPAVVDLSTMQQVNQGAGTSWMGT